MLTIYMDAYACPVEDEVYQVARRYSLRVMVVANAPLRVPANPLFQLVVRPGFGTADDWIALAGASVFLRKGRGREADVPHGEALGRNTGHEAPAIQ